MKLQQKIFLSYLFFISLFSVVIIGALCFFFSEQAWKDRLNSAEKTFTQTSELLNYQFDQFQYTSYIVNNSEEITNAMHLPRKELTNSPGKQHLHATEIRDAVNRSLLPLSNVSMCIYLDDAFHHVLDSHMLDSHMLNNISELNELFWYPEFISGNKQAVWQLNTHTDIFGNETFSTLSYFRKIETVASVKWVSEIYIEIDEVKEMLSGADPTGGGAVFLQLKNGTLLAANDEDLYEQFFAASEEPFVGKVRDWEKINLQDREYWLYSRMIPSTGWYMTLLLPYASASISLTGLLGYMLLLVAAVLIVSILAASFFTRSFSWRLLALNEKMEALCGGDLDTRIEEHGNDEITHVFRSFNHMANEMKQLIQQQYENGIRVKTAELNALQAQINPHFLYNTLELINWKAMENDSPEIVEITQNLASFYRLTLNDGRSMVQLCDEIKQVLYYVDIQNFRFSQEVRMLLDIPKDCMNVSVPKLTLQPLVENCIMHGFIPREETDEQNTIFIQAARDGADLCITVSDNGVGMTEAHLEKVLLEKNFDSEHGFGVLNIQQRIRMLYGENYGLTYSRAVPQGTSVLVRLKIDS